ncbi:MAG: replication initiation factor domain-containing protein [Pontiella sp.]
MSRRSTRRMDTKGLRILRANEYRLNQEAAVRARHSYGASPSNGESGEAAPPTLLGGVTGKFIGKAEKFDKRVSIIPSQHHLGKMDTGERTSSIGVDWIQGTIPFERLDLVRSYLTAVCGQQPEDYDHGLMSFQTSCEWHPFGIKLAWDLDKKNRENHSNRILLQLTGSSLHNFTPVHLWRFLKDLSVKFWFNCTRIDLAFDDFEKIIRPDEVNEFANQGAYKGFRKHKYIGGVKRDGTVTDDGIYFGTRGKDGGGKFLRCYGKDIESKGEIDAIRWEVEFTKDKADKIFFELAMSDDVTDMATKIALFIGGSIDFAERTKSGRFNKEDRLAFWEQLLHHLGSAEVRCPKVEGDIESAMDWVELSVTPSLEKIRQAIGDDIYYQWLYELMEDADLSEKAQGQIIHYHSLNGEPAPF